MFFADNFSRPPTTTITSNPTGAGLVLVDNHPTTTPAQFVWNIGDTHTLSASYNGQGAIGERYFFGNWSDGGQQSHDITAPSNTTTIQANFQEQYQLNISAPISGSTEPPSGSYWYNSTQNAVVTADPSPGYSVDEWTLDGLGSGNSNPITIPMNSSHNLIVTFSQQPSLIVSSGTGGTISVNSSAINGGNIQTLSTNTSQKFLVPAGSLVTLTANPVNSFLFTNWTGTQFYGSRSISFSVNSDLSQTANFAPPFVNVTFSASGLSASTSGTILTLDGSSYAASALPLTVQLLAGTTHQFAWSANVSGSIGTRYIWQSTSGLTSAAEGSFQVPVSGGTIASLWKTQYQVTFQTVGLDSSALGAVLNLGNNQLASNQLPLAIWADSSSSLAFSFQPSVESSTYNTGFNLSQVSSASPLTINSAIAVSASYTHSTPVQLGSKPTNGGGPITVVSNRTVTITITPPTIVKNVTQEVTVSTTTTAATTTTLVTYSTVSASLPSTSVSSTTSSSSTSLLTNVATLLALVTAVAIVMAGVVAVALIRRKR